MHWLLSSLTSILGLTDSDNDAASKVNFPSTSNTLECQKNSKLAHMPEDVIFLILNHLDKASKFRLARTCRYFQQLLECILYRHISFDFSGSGHQAARLHRTLLERPSLIPHIRSYHGELMSTFLFQKRSFLEKHFGRKKSRFITSAEALEKAVAIFTQATNIVDLDFQWSPDWTSVSYPSFEPIRLAISKMSLKRLNLGWDCTDVDRILRNQPELEELEVGSQTYGVHQLDETDLPKLKSLTASLREAASLVPGRPIEKMQLSQTSRDQYHFDDQLFRNLSLSTGPITEFSAYLYVDNSYEGENFRAVLQVISRNLPQLERLKISVSGSISGRVIVEEVPAFRFLRCLTFLNANLTNQSHNHSHEVASDFSQSDEAIQQAPDLEDWDDVFDHLRRLCPLLVNTKFTPRAVCGCYPRHRSG